MATTKTIQTRIKNRFDTLANWKGQGVELLPGEIALVSIATKQIDQATGNVINVPAVLMKVGESNSDGGTKSFSELPWVSALAADVYDWAKKADPSTIKIKYNVGTEAEPSFKEAALSDVLKDLETAKADIAAFKSNVLDSISIDPVTATEDGVVQGVTYDNKTGKFTVSYGQVETKDINDEAVTEAKIAPDAVTSNKIKNGAVTNDKVAATGISSDKITVGSDAADGTLSKKLSAMDAEIARLQGVVTGGVHFLGTVSAEPTDASVIINGKEVTAEAGDIVIWAEKGLEYIYTDPAWEELGDPSGLAARIEELDYDEVVDGAATDNKFVTKVTQTSGRIAVTYAQPASLDISHVKDGTNTTVKAELDTINAEIASHIEKHDVYKNQNAFSKIAVEGQTTVEADSATDTITFEGENVTIITTVADDKVKFAVADGSTSAKGVVKLNDTVMSESTSEAATAKAVKTAYDIGAQGVADAAAIAENYIKIDTDNNLVNQANEIIIFDCGGAPTAI